MSWEKAITFVIEEEGGYTADPKDPGNWTLKGFRGELKGTKFGISALSFPKLDIKGLTEDEARAIYRQNYWTAARCEEFPPGLGVVLFDTAVNCGTTTAIMILQRALGIVPDGKIGPQTLKAGRAGAAKVPGFLAHRMNHYHKLCVESPGLERFFVNWAKRVMRLSRLCAGLS